LDCVASVMTPILNMAAHVCHFWIIATAVFLIGVYAQTPHKKFEYKYSFKGPYLAQRDGTVPFWEHGGSAIASEESIRITPSLRSKKGYAWTKNKTNFDWWEVELVFRISGRGRIGADGLALWFTEERGVEGPVFGSNDRWKGLGIFFDSFDNDNKHNNPYMMGVANDGTMSFDHQNDGATQQLAGCLRDYRNKPFPVKAKLEYYNNALTLLFHGGMTSNDQDYEVCFRADNVYLPQSGYFGISAATGGLADDHDVLAFLVSSVQSPEQYMQASQQAISESEKERLGKEFDEYKQRLDKQKEDYRRENPELARQKELEEKPEEWFESDAQRELQQIFLGQGKIFDVLRELDRKMIEIIGRQERALSILSAVQVGAGAGQQVPVGTGHQAAVGVGDTIRRHEVDMVLNTQREIAAVSKDIKAFVQDIHKRSGTGQGTVTAGVGPDVQNLLNELKEGMNSVRRDVSNVATLGGGGCPTVSCVSTSIFIVFLAIQIIILLGYSIYKDKKETQAKKFY